MVEQLNDQIEITEAPPVPGLTFRRFRGESDYPKMVAVLSGCKEADGEERVNSVEEVARNYSLLVNCNPYEDMIFAEVDGEVIGYGRVFWIQEVDGPRVYIHFGWVLPQWRRRGIGRAMLCWQEARLREIAAGHAVDCPRFFQNGASDTEHAKRALLLSEGYSPFTQDALMVRPNLEDIPDAPLPEGIEVRPVQPEHLRAIWEADHEAFRDHHGYTEDDDTYEQFLAFAEKYGTALWRIAWDGDQVVGQVKTFIDEQENAEYHRRRGWTEGISVRRPWRRRGIARALIAQSLRMLKECGMEEAALGVHTENPNKAYVLYESLGFRVVKLYTIYRKPVDAIE